MGFYCSAIICLIYIWHQYLIINTILIINHLQKDLRPQTHFPPRCYFHLEHCSTEVPPYKNTRFISIVSHPIKVVLLLLFLIEVIASLFTHHSLTHSSTYVFDNITKFKPTYFMHISDIYQTCQRYISCMSLTFLWHVSCRNLSHVHLWHVSGISQTLSGKYRVNVRQIVGKLIHFTCLSYVNVKIKHTSDTYIR